LEIETRWNAESAMREAEARGLREWLTSAPQDDAIGAAHPGCLPLPSALAEDVKG
jgi:hypothetical protein